MRESIIFLNIVLLALVLAGRMIFNDIDYGQGEEAKRHVDVCSWKNMEDFIFFCLAIFGKNIKSIGISKVLYIILSFKTCDQILHW